MNADHLSEREFEFQCERTRNLSIWQYFASLSLPVSPLLLHLIYGKSGFSNRFPPPRDVISIAPNTVSRRFQRPRLFFSAFVGGLYLPYLFYPLGSSHTLSPPMFGKSFMKNEVIKSWILLWTFIEIYKMMNGRPLSASISRQIQHTFLVSISFSFQNRNLLSFLSQFLQLFFSVNLLFYSQEIFISSFSPFSTFLGLRISKIKI